MTTVCTATYATGRCLSSSHSTFPVASASSMLCRPFGTPATPRLPSTPGCPPPLARRCSTPCARRALWAPDGEQRALADGIGVEDGDALVVAHVGHVGPAQGRGAHP